MPKHTLLYLNGKGRGEIIRLAFALAGVEYTDKRITFDEWLEMKPKTDGPFRYLPQVQIEGGPVLQESIVITEYICESNGYGGKDDIERAQIRSVVSYLDFLFSDGIDAFFEKDEAKKAALSKTLNEERKPTVFGNLEKMLAANNGGGGFMVGDKESAADLMVFYVCEDSGFLKDMDYPLLKALAGRVAKLPNIAAWLEKRPKTEW